MAEPVEYKRIFQKVDTLAGWNANPLILGDGEQAFVRGGGVVLNFRMGDGTKRFSELPNVIQYDQAAYVAPLGNTLPVPQNGIGYSILTAGTYNGNLVVPVGNLGVADYVGNAWVVRNMEIPNGAALVAPASSKTSWAENEITRLDDGSLLVAVVNTTQTPQAGASDWRKVGGDDFDKEVQDALGGASGTIEYRPPSLPSAVLANSPNVFINDSLVTPSQNGLLKKIYYRSGAAGSRTFYVMQLVSGRTFVTVSAHSATVVAGQNEINVNIPYSGKITIACPGDGSLGIYAADGNEFNTRYAFVGLTSLQVGQQYEFQLNQFAFGWIDLGFEVEVTGAPSGEEFLKKTWSYVNTPTAGGVTVDRVTIAGQSNAYGTGALSELSNPIFAENEINWQGAFNRVFIWDKFSNEYRKLQIGVTNMASWDGRYANPAGSPSPFPTFGPEIGLAISWLHGNKSGQLYIHKDLGDGRPISYFQKGGAAYTDFMQQYEAGNDWLALRGLAVKSLGFLWVQGESDNGQSQGYYQGQLSTLIESYSEDGIIKPYSNIVLALINPENGGYSAAINAAKVAYAESNPNASTVQYSNNLNPDGVHLNALGNILLGLGAGQTINRVDPLTPEQMYTLPNYTT